MNFVALQKGPAIIKARKLEQVSRSRFWDLDKKNAFFALFYSNNFYEKEES